MSRAFSRFLCAGLLVFSFSACSSESASDQPVAVVLNIGLSAEELQIDGVAIPHSELSQVIQQETKLQATLASISIADDVSVASVNELMSILRSSDILGVHYTTNNEKQAFYRITL